MQAWEEHDAEAAPLLTSTSTGRHVRANEIPIASKENVARREEAPRDEAEPLTVTESQIKDVNAHGSPMP